MAGSKTTHQVKQRVNGGMIRGLTLPLELSAFGAGVRTQIRLTARGLLKFIRQTTHRLPQLDPCGLSRHRVAPVSKLTVFHDWCLISEVHAQNVSRFNPCPGLILSNLMVKDRRRHDNVDVEALFVSTRDLRPCHPRSKVLTPYQIQLKAFETHCVHNCNWWCRGEWWLVKEKLHMYRTLQLSVSLCR